ncbi:MAG: GMC family oxidoreductase [Stagnimonas sp.]|nr:GMC family oxidoreductase [Stagnimonas sp.]
MSSTEASYDYVVIGGGSSGCIVAARLAEANAGSVLLLEAGEPAEAHPESLSADGFKYAFANDALMWHRMSTPQASCGGRPLYIGSGRGMGGSGSVNGMVYTRGDRRDYLDWPVGWHWDDLQPSFEAIEAKLGIRPRVTTAFADRFIAAGVAAGFRRKDGMNDGDLGGVLGCNDMNYAGGERRSSYRAWIKDAPPARLTVVTGASVQRLVFDEAHRAIAVEYRKDGQGLRVGVTGEAVLCAGALETPKLLMLSGVGPRAQLEALAIPVVHNSAGVGQHLQDHPNVCLFYRSQAPVDFQYPQVYGFEAVLPRSADAAPDTCFVCYAAPASLQQSMQRMVPILALPGRLYAVTALRRLLRGMVNLAFKLPLLQRYVAKVFGIVVILGKPTSRGSLRLASRDPAVPAEIDLDYYATTEDRERILAGVARAQAIAAQAPLQQVRATPLSLGGKRVPAEKIWKWIGAATMTTFHYCGSCRMGEDAASPVDLQLRVKGLANVRVADASAVPEIPVSALNAPSMVLGYRAADLILAGRTA